MNFDINAIIERMCVAAGVKNNSQLSAYLGRNHSVISGWKNKKVPPFEDCWKIHISTGVDMHWLITGEDKQHPTPPNDPKLTDDFVKIKKAFLRALTQGYEFGYFAHTVKTTDETLELMAGMLYADLTGKDITEVLEKPKQADAG